MQQLEGDKRQNVAQLERRKTRPRIEPTGSHQQDNDHTDQKRSKLNFTAHRSRDISNLGQAPLQTTASKFA
jgi:hypothetical protein